MKKGAYTLLITPFDEGLKLDKQGLKTLVKRQIDAGIQGISPLGVTGENTLMTEEELLEVIGIIVQEAKGKLVIAPELCTMSTWKSIERAKKYADKGADLITVFAPYLILPSSGGIIRFYEELAEQSPIPILLHNAKARTGVEITPEMTAHLSKHPNIVGTKDGNKQLDHLAKVLYLTKDENFDVYTGKDATAFPFMAIGGSGTFTVAGNVVPEVMAKMAKLTIEKKYDEAKQMHLRYYELFEALRFETNPMAAKKSLQLMNLPAGSLRPPLTELSEQKTILLKAILEQSGCLL